MQPEKIPPEVNGIITSNRVRMGLAPKSPEASSKLPSNFSMAVYKGKTINGMKQ